MDEMPTSAQNIDIFANRAIAASLFRELAVDAEAGLSYLNQYLLDLSLVAAGARLSELNLSERRKEHQSSLLTGSARVYDSALIYNSGLTPDESVAVLRVVGFMQAESSGGSSPARGMRSFAEDLYAAYSNPKIKGVLLEINSGGGELLAMDVATSAVEARNKPVVSHVYFASSAAYGLAASSDEIVALSGMTRVGGVGAVVSLNRKALQEYAESWLDIYGTTAPRKNAEFRAALQGDFSPLQQVVDDATERFQKKVAKLRGLDLSDDLSKDALSGDMFTAHQAKRRGLVDGIGGLNYVLKRLDAWAEIYKQKV